MMKTDLDDNAEGKGDATDVDGDNEHVMMMKGRGDKGYKNC